MPVLKKSKPELPKKNVSGKTVPLYVTFIAMVLTGFTTYHFLPEGHPEIITMPSHDCPEGFQVIQNNNYKYIRPTYLIDVRNENEKLAALKESIHQFIEQRKSSKELTNASVYYRNLNDGSWFEINGRATYVPASLAKVVTMIAIFKDAESNPHLLEKTMLFEKHIDGAADQNGNSVQLKEHTSYTVKELLTYMIEYSDNDATGLLLKIMDRSVYRKIYTDLGIAPPADDPTIRKEFYISLNDYCKLFRVLYNGSYLNDVYSEMALSMLTKSTYRDGLLKNLDSNLLVAHKSGERLLNADDAQLHEVGIFYVGDQPYLLGVMSHGKNVSQLSGILAGISKLVYASDIH